MTQPDQAQNVLAPPAWMAIFLVVIVRPGAEDDVRSFLSEVSGLLRAVGFREPEGELSCVVGIGAQLWDRPFESPRPVGLFFVPTAEFLNDPPAPLAAAATATAG